MGEVGAWGFAVPRSLAHTPAMHQLNVLVTLPREEPNKNTEFNQSIPMSQL